MDICINIKPACQKLREKNSYLKTAYLTSISAEYPCKLFS